MSEKDSEFIITLWIDESERILSFHEMENAEKIEIKSNEFYDRFLKIYLATGYRFQ